LVTFKIDGKNHHTSLTHTHTHAQNIKLYVSSDILVLTDVEQCHVNLTMHDTPKNVYSYNPELSFM